MLWLRFIFLVLYLKHCVTLWLCFLSLSFLFTPRMGFHVGRKWKLKKRQNLEVIFSSREIKQNEKTHHFVASCVKEHRSVYLLFPSGGYILCGLLFHWDCRVKRTHKADLNVKYFHLVKSTSSWHLNSDCLPLISIIWNQMAIRQVRTLVQVTPVYLSIWPPLQFPF